MEVELEGEAELEVMGKRWICSERFDQGLDPLADIGGIIWLVLGPAMGVIWMKSHSRSCMYFRYRDDRPVLLKVINSTTNFNMADGLTSAQEFFLKKAAADIGHMSYIAGRSHIDSRMHHGQCGMSSNKCSWNLSQEMLVWCMEVV